MNKNELIASGVLELYVLNTCTEQELAQIEPFLTDVDIQAELAQIEATMFVLAESRAISPRAEVKDLIKAELFNATKSKVEDNNINKEIPLKSSNNFAWRIAAGFMLLVSIGMFTIYNGKMRQMDKRLSELSIEKESVEKNYAEIKTVSQNLSQVENFFANRLIKSYELRHPNIADKVFGVVYWCPATGELMLNGMEMPILSEKEQYQLWALVDGQPVDLGVIPKDWDGKTDKLAHLKGVKELSAYAITIEPLHGSKEPTLEKLTALAEV